MGVCVWGWGEDGVEWGWVGMEWGWGWGGVVECRRAVTKLYKSLYKTPPYSTAARHRPFTRTQNAEYSYFNKHFSEDYSASPTQSTRPTRASGT
ncbi:hypothetical protein DPMN_159319 [Dreissena polymorpha]|uniref:Uncharacterized protein n=1 Tax=Dreissena polymorpha TaxID=45954 RepID=A0A9D4IQL6_DREPO|nr:hypothetical protein DPMN_159319 [Dreissena polymorpha]